MLTKGEYDFGEFCARIATWCTIAFMLGLVAYIFFHYLFYEGPYQSLLVINSEKYKSLSIKLGYGISGDIVISKTYRDGDRDSNSNSGNRKGETGGVIKKKNILIGASLNASTPELLEGLATSLVLNHVLSTAEATIFLQMSDAEIDKALQSGGETFVRVEIMFPRIWTTYKTIEIENSFKGNVQVDLGYFSQIHLENDFIIKARNGDVSITNVKVDRELRIDAPSGQLKAASTAVEGVVRARAGKDVDMRLNTSRNRALDIQVTSDTGLAHLDMPNQFYGHFSVATTSTSPPKLQSPESYTTLQISNGSRMEGFVSWDGAEPPPLPRVEVKGNTASLELR
ncbi:hypothetical protein BX616_010571 [Lobosporangium transversale]|nr:hypothetical protein BX616_010571 [Lobosporangium transversale]